ncbi:DUF3857 domain-containing protein [Olleya sp. HaHaR_3_96]|uniref:DUF3857 domain-containing protein n=1 Tax=Olleya sp. HaHaR_3_96 TaxID=2745560 RepID=UPI001C4EC9DE|nr:DUF3857 domain-containing protein [Olleya sp. HaHaR_3_96]QXP61214.1 DUF3857 domain-containing protein [Olleya sp. HaHaR_3_96]
MPTNTFLKSILCVLFFSVNVFSQDNYQALVIKPELQSNANAIVRSSTIDVNIEARDKIVVTEQRVVTVLNERGQRYIGAVVYYDQSKSIKTLEAIILNAFGNEIKKFKKKDFIDVSVADGISIFTDNRARYINYTPVSYPFTVVFNLEFVSSNTAFIPQWYPIDDYYLSVEKASYKIQNQTDIPLDFKISNLEAFEIEKMSDLHYQANNLSAIKKEAYSPSFYNVAPSVKFALKQFSMLGVEGDNSSWNDFGKWMSDKLINGTQALPETVKVEIKALTKNAKTDLEKAKIVYQFMQNKTRYISVQVGIGGWKPMLASDVDRLGYGDCKGLSNYTKALLDEVGVTSYYTIVYGGEDVRSIDQSFSSLQGNHAILSIPYNDSYITLECTNQSAPFGYNANFTDDRDVLIVTPLGGEIVHTKVYSTNENSQIINSNIILDSLGGFKAALNIISKGTQYDKYRRIEAQTEKENRLYYKDHFSDINNLQVNSMIFNNDKDNIVFREDLDLQVDKYVTKAGERWLMQPNFFNKFKTAPPRYKNRKLPFEIDRGFIDEDQYQITLPDNVKIEALQDDVVIKNKFGEYHYSIKQIDDKNLVFKRKIIINKGQFLKEDYSAFRKFKLAIVKHDKSKIVLTTTN